MPSEIGKKWKRFGNRNIDYPLTSPSPSQKVWLYAIYKILKYIIMIVYFLYTLY